MRREPDPFATPAERTAAIRDDPFARAAQADRGAPGGGEPSDTLLGPLARRDPDAAPETTGVHPTQGAASLDDVLRRARWSGFLAGLVVGALLVGGAALLAAWWTAPPPGAGPVR